MELFITFIGLWTIYLVMIFINIWCMAAFLFVAFDKLWLESYEKQQVIKERLIQKNKLKVLPGGKDEGI